MAEFTTTQPVTEGSPKQIRRFSPEAKDFLQAKGLEIFDLSGKSLADLRREGKRIGSGGYALRYERIGAKHSEVAIRPNDFFSSWLQ